LPGHSRCPLEGGDAEGGAGEGHQKLLARYASQRFLRL
jgi:hypothetical protein